MSEKLCTLRTKGGGGGRYTETSLWTNSSPTDSFSGQNVTLSDSMSKYKYLKFTWKVTTTGSNIASTIVPVSDFATMDNTDGKQKIGINGKWTYDFARLINYVSDTTVRFDTNFRLNSSGNNNGVNIPLEILGLNELAHGKRFDETTLWTNSASSSTFAAQVITLSDDIDNYDYIAIDYKYANNTSDSDYSTVMQTPANIKKGGYNTSVTRCGLALDYISGGNANYARQVFYVSNTSLRFDIGRQIGGTNSSNASAIPLRVVGCKFR